MEQPLVSVVMATFNEPVDYITRSIESILLQSYHNLELLIADDSNNPDTIAIIDNFAKQDKRIIVIRRSQRMGFVKALNEALRMAKGDFIARMDGDDISLALRLQTQVAYLLKHSDVDILGGSMNIINEKGEICSERKYPLGGFNLFLWSIIRNPLAHPTVMFRSTIVHQGNFYDETQKKAEDIEFWLRLRNKGFRIANLRDKLLCYRVPVDFVCKRNREQWMFNFKARKKNFSRNNLIFSVCSILISLFFLLIPPSVVSCVYKLENNK